MQIYNTLTRQKEKFKPLKEEKTKVYYCGPTVYNNAHIGNLTTYIFEDIAVKTLRFLGYKVESVMNITDIDDKTIRDSQKTWEKLFDFTKKYTEIFLNDIAKLGISKADHIVPISEVVPEMITIIQWLIDKGYAYLAEDNSIYFSISKFRKYWELANLDMKWMKTSVRINNDEYDKENAADFALWKAYDEKLDWPNFWEAKLKINWEEKTLIWRPGWHIECSAVNHKIFGPQIDLHMGWIDNIFPHHQNEIAQSEAFSWKKFSQYWAHTWHLLVDNKKMAKSAGNFYTLSDVVANLPEYKEELVYRGFRLMRLQSRYRESFNFTFDKLKQSIENIKYFDETFKKLENYTGEEGKTRVEFRNILQWFIQQYITYLEDDFNTVEAIALIYELFKIINSRIDSSDLYVSEKEAIIELLKTIDSVITVFDFDLLTKKEEIPFEVQELLNRRLQAKMDKNYELADSIRDQIVAMWYKILDVKGWTRVEKI